jgi:tripartite-type tricarboxylate transporter receptor subunit TctC
MLSFLAKAREDVMRRVLATLFFALTLSGAAHAQTANYPNKPVRVIVPFAAAGPTDVIARLIVQKLSDSLRQQFYVENIPGAGGNTGTGTAAKTAGDGYTILVVSTGFIINPSLSASVPYDPIKDFAPVTLAAASPNVLTVNPSVPAKTIKELVDLVKANPGKYSYAQPSTGSTPHLAGELFKLRFGLDIVTVPYNSAALAITSTIAGHTPIAFTALPPAVTNVREGKLRALAVTMDKRVAALPDVPTMEEAGGIDQVSETLTGVVVPAATPRPIVELLHREIVKIVALPEVQERLTGLGFVPVANTPDEFAARIKTEMPKWAKVIREANIKGE